MLASTGPPDENRLAHLLSQYGLGISYLLAVVLLWTASNFITQDLYSGGYNKPFLVTYLNTTSFAFYLIPYALRKFFYKRPSPVTASTVYQPLESDVDEEAIPIEQEDLELPPLTESETASLSLQFWLLWFLANWTLNASLEFTSVASSTVLASTSGFFTLLVTWVFRMEQVSRTKIIGVLASFVGVALVANSDRALTPAPVPHRSIREVAVAASPVFGDLLALGSAIFYSLYITLLKVRIREESRVDMPLFFGFVGLFNIFLGVPVLGLLHVTGAEDLEWPNARRAWITIITNMLITLSSDYMYVLAMLKTRPLVVTVGISLTIPFALIGDAFLAIRPEVQAVLGACLVLASFVAVGIGGNERSEGSEGSEGD